MLDTKNNNNTPAITSSEISAVEEKFKQNVTPLVQFTKGANGHSMTVYNGSAGVEAIISGTIILKTNNFIKFSLSIQKGANIEAKFQLEDDNAEIIGKLSEFYTQFREEWSQKLTMQNPDASIDGDISKQQAPGTPAGGQTPEPSAVGPGAPTPVTEITRNMENIIKEHSERMRRLAGITTNTPTKESVKFTLPRP